MRIHSNFVAFIRCEPFFFVCVSHSPFIKMCSGGLYALVFFHLPIILKNSLSLVRLYSIGLFGVPFVVSEELLTLLHTQFHSFLKWMLLCTAEAESE